MAPMTRWMLSAVIVVIALGVILFSRFRVAGPAMADVETASQPKNEPGVMIVTPTPVVFQMRLPTIQSVSSNPNYTSPL